MIIAPQQKPVIGHLPNPNHWSIKDASAFYVMNSRSGKIIDYSGNGNHGTNNGATWVGGRDGSALDFSQSGTAEINAGDPTGLNFGTDDFTLITTFKTNDTSEQTLCSKKNGFDEGFWNSLSSTTGYPYFEIEQVGGTRLVLNGTIDLRDNKWHQCVCVKTSTTTYIWIDGTLNVSGNHSVVNSINATVDYLIGNFYSAFREFSGQMDHHIAYPYALTANQIKSLYENPFQAWEYDDLSLWAGVQAVSGFKPAWARHCNNIIGAV